jgi:hypothetical protein
MPIRFPASAAPAPSSANPERGAMQPPTTDQKAIGHDESPVHTRRVSRLDRLGVPGRLAEIYADCIDWHKLAQMVRRGCSPGLALRIVG